MVWSRITAGGREGVDGKRELVDQVIGAVGGLVEFRAPADREVSIKDSGFTRTGLGVTVLCLHTVA